MLHQTSIAGRRSAIAIAVIIAGGMIDLAVGSAAVAQDAAPAADALKTDVPPPRPKKRHVVRKAPKPAEKADVSRNADAQSAVAAMPDPKTPVPPTTAPVPSVAPASVDFTAQLDKAGASACRSQVNALANSVMGSVVKYNTVSNWSQVAGDKRAVSLAIGQKYAEGSAVPFGVAQIVSAPNRQGNCDGFTVQVFPSPLSCDKLRETMTAAQGRQIGDLAGVSLIQDAAGRAMLVPTAANTCVLVATRVVYPN